MPSSRSARVRAAIAAWVVFIILAATERTGFGAAHHANHAVERFVASVHPYLNRWGYAAVFATVAIEAVGVPAPGHTMLIAAALAAARGTLDIRWVVLTGAIATVVGSQIAWIIGRRANEFIRRRSRSQMTHLARTERAFARWGGWVVVFGPFVEGIRQLNALAAGALEMPWKRFALYNLAGAILWVTVWGIGTWFLVDKITGVLSLVDDARPWLLALTAAVLVGGAAWIIANRRRAARTASANRVEDDARSADRPGVP